MLQSVDPNCLDRSRSGKSLKKKGARYFYNSPYLHGLLLPASSCRSLSFGRTLFVTQLPPRLFGRMIAAPNRSMFSTRVSY